MASARTVSRLLGSLAVLAAGSAAGLLLLPNPLADAFFAGWVLGSVILALIGGISAWTNRTPLVWVAALLLTGISIVGIWSIGRFVAPAAVLLLGAAIFSQLAGPRTEVIQAITANPPTESELVQKSLLGAGSLVVGTGLVYLGAFTRELFGACANETLACAIESTHWGAASTTILGVIAISLGGWLLWKQAYIARVLAAKSRST